MNIAIFASGSGTNARKMLEYFADKSYARINLIVCNRAEAGVLNIAREYHIPFLIINREQFQNADLMLEELTRHHIGFIVLAGFLWRIPAYLVEKFPRRIVNIHPALLPKYGGKGMYGHFVHEAVQASGDTETGITIHYVNEHYDEGDIIFQASCTIEPGMDIAEIAQRVQILEHRHFPEVVDNLVKSLLYP